MLKIKDLFKKKKICSNEKYKVGDTVYSLAYPFKSFYFGNRVEHQGLGEEIKIYKMKITKIEFNENDNKPRYYTNRKTGLECDFGGYYGFDGWEKIKEAIDEFVVDDYKHDLVEKVEEVENDYI